MRKIFRRYMIITTIVLVVSLFLSWGFSSHFFEILTMDYSAPDLSGSKAEVQSMFLNSILTWENFVDSSMFYIINFLPGIVVLPTIVLFEEKKMQFTLAKNHFANLRKSILVSVLRISLLSALTSCMVLTIYYSIGGIFMHREIDHIGGFADFLPEYFYEMHPYLFFLIMVWTIYLATFFVLSFLACSLSLTVGHPYQTILAVVVICILLSFVSNLFSFPIFNIYISLLAYNSGAITTYQLFVPVLCFAVIGLIFYWFGEKKMRLTY